MATATVTPTLYSWPKGIDFTNRNYVISGTLVIAASPDTYATNGLPVSFKGAKDTVGSFQYPSSDEPWAGEIWSASSGYVYRYDPAHATVRIFETGAASGDPLSEISNGTAIPAGVSGDTIYFTVKAVRE